LIQVANHGNTGAGMQVFFRNLGVLVETHAFDPSGLVSAGFECQGKRCDGITLAPEEDFWIVAEVAS
jgi:hypothetical protein